MPDSRQKLYNALSSQFDLGSFDDFNSKMNNPDSRKKLYSAVSSKFDLGSFDDFESKIGGTPKKKVPTQVSKPSVGSSGTTETPQKQSSDSSKPDGIYKFPTNLKANYKKENGQWYVDPSGGTKFQPLTKGDVTKRVKVLESQAKYDLDLTTYNMPDKVGTNTLLIRSTDENAQAINDKYKQEQSDRSKAKVFTGFPTKEQNKYRVVDGIWQKSAPNDKGEYSDWVTVDNELSIKALNRQFKQNAGLDVVKTKQEYAKIGFKDINSNLIGGDEGDAVPYLTNKYGNLGFKFEEGLGDQMIVSSSIPGVKPLTINMDSWDDEKDANNAAILKAYLSQNALTKEKEKEVSFTEKYQNIALDRTGNAYVDETKRLADLEAGKLNLPKTELQQSLEQQKKNERIQNLEKETGLNMREIQDEKARKAKIYGSSKVFKGDLTATAIAEQNKVNKVYVNNEIKDINLRNKLSLRLSEQFDNDMADFNANYDTYSEEERAIKEAELKQKATELKQVYDQTKKDSSHVNYLVQSQAASTIASKLVAEKTGTVAGAIGRSLTDAIIDSGMGIYQAGYGIAFDESPITTEDRQKVKDNIAKMFTNTTSEFTASEDRSLMTSTIVALTQMAPAILANVATRGAASKLTGVAAKVAANAPGTAYFWGMGYSNAFDSMNGLDISDDDKRKLSFSIATATAALESYGLEKITSNKAASGFVAKRVARLLSGLPKGATMEMMNTAIYADMKKVVADKLIKVAGKGIIEGGVEVSQSAAEQEIKDLYEIYKDKDVFQEDWGTFGKNALREFLVGSFAGATVNSMSNLGTTVQQLSDPENFGLSKEIATDEDLQDLFKNDLKSKIIQGEMSIPEAKAKLRAVGEFKALLGKVPSNMLETNQQEAMKLIEEKQKLQSEIEGKEPSLVEDQKQRIVDIDNEMKQLVEDDAKGEIRITARGLDQVPTEFRDRARYRGTSKVGRFGKTTDDYVYTVTRDEYTKLKGNAVQERSTEEVLPREQEQAGETGGQREGMGQSLEGQEVTQESTQKVEDLRAQEQAELMEAIPNAEKYMTDGKVDRTKITDENDLKVFDEIYNKYDKIITPLIRETEVEDVVIPQNELDALNEELSRNKDEGTINDNLDQAGYIGDEYGTIRIDPENENTVVFETNSQIIELGSIDDVKDSDISSFGISLFPQTEVKAQDETNAITFDGKKYKIIGRRRDKKGKAVVRVKELETGLERRIIGEKAEQILKDQALAKNKKPGVNLNLATEGKEPVVENKKRSKKEDAKKAKEEFESKTLEELKAEEDRLEKEVKDFEDNLLQEIAKESKKEKKLTFKIKDAEFTVSEKSDGTYSVSQKNENGKFVGIKDDAKRKAAISEYKKIRESNDTNRLNLATELTEDFKREKDDKILALLDRAIAATSFKGKMFNFSGGSLQMLANTSLKIIRASYKAGKSLSEAIKDGYKFIKDNNASISEYDYKKFVAENINKPIVEESESEVTVASDEKVPSKEISRLKEEVKAYFKGKRDSKKEIMSVIKNISTVIKSMVTKGQMDSMQFKYIMNKLSRVNFNKQSSIDDFIDYVFNKMMKAEYVKKIKEIDAISKSIKNNKSIVEPIASTVKEFANINPTLVDNIDTHLAIAKQIKESLSRYKKETDPLGIEFRKNVDFNKVFDYVQKNKDKILKKSKKEISDIYDAMFGENSSDGMTDEYMSEKIKEAKENELNKLKSFVQQKISSIKAIVENDPTVSDLVKRAANVDVDYLNLSDAIDVVNALTMYLDNGFETGLNKIVANYEGTKAVEDSNLKFAPIGVVEPGRSTARGYNDFFSYIEIMLEKKSLKAGDVVKFLKESAFGLIQKGYNRSENETNQLRQDYKNKFKKIKKFFDPENKAERALLSFVQRNVLDSEGKPTEFLRRKKLVLESIDQLRKSAGRVNLAIADLQEEAAKKLGILKSDGTVNESITIDEINNNAEKSNLEAVKWMQDMWYKKYSSLYDHALGMHNTLIGRDEFYTPDRYSSIDRSIADDPNLIEFINFTGMTVNKSGVLMEARRPDALTDRFINMDFEDNNFGSYRAAMNDLYTAEARTKYKAYQASSKFDDIMGRDKYRKSEDATLIRDAYKRYITAKENKGAKDSKIELNVKKFLNKISTLSGAAGLASVKNVFAQTFTTYLDTIVAAGPRSVATIFKDSFNPDVWKFIAKADSQVANRGMDAIKFTERIQEEVMKKSKAAEAAGTVFNAPVWLAEQMLKYTNQKGDKLSAIGAWMTYYRKYCRKNGIKVDLNNVNQDAAQYAETKTKVQILPSDASERGSMGANNTLSASMIRQILFPFSSFSINQKNRIYADIAKILRGEWSLRKEAIQDLAGTVTGLITFHTINTAWKYFIIQGAISLFLDDEDEDALKKTLESALKLSGTQALTDLFSAIPLLDPLLIMGANWMLGEGEDNMFAPSEDKWLAKLAEINQARDDQGKRELDEDQEAKRREKFFKDEEWKFYEDEDITYLDKFGVYGIAAQKAVEFKDIAKSAATGIYEDKYQGNMTEKTLTKEGKEKMEALALVKAVGLITGATDLSNIAQKSFYKVGKKYSLTDNQVKISEETKEWAKEHNHKLDKYDEQLIKIHTTLNQIKRSIRRMDNMSTKEKEEYIKTLKTD